MCNQNQGISDLNQENDCGCSCQGREKFLSRKKRIEALKLYLAELEEKADDIKEYIKELESAS